MLRGSRPGERRGGRSRGTPNRRTILRDRILAIGSDHSAATQRAFLRKLLKDRKLPAEIRIAIAPQCFPAKLTPLSRSGSSRALAGRRPRVVSRRSFTRSPAVVPAMRYLNPKALEVLFGIVQDATAHPMGRRRAALKIAEFLLPKVAKKAKVIADEYGFLISPNLASGYRDIRLELRALDHPATRKIPAIAEMIEKLRACSDRILRRLRMPYPTTYGDKEAANDIERLIELSDNQTTLTEAQKAEEAHLRVRYDLYRASPQPIARRRREALENVDQQFKRHRASGEFPAPALSRREQNDLNLLRRLYPAEPKQNLSPLDDNFDGYRYHPFADDLLARDGNFYPRHSKLRLSGAAGDLLAQTGDGPPITPVSPCSAPATNPIQSVEPPSCDRLSP